jgi:eukaryotic-like serine/threonine-protein kinase
MRTSSPVAEGEVIAGKYVVERVLGSGAMGVVVSAWHIGLEQRVALKLLRRDASTDEPALLERFAREARAVARIDSEHVCRVLDTGSLPDGTPFLVMEYLAGRDLEEELSACGRIDVAQAVCYVRQACDALGAAHAASIVHRDLKPANLFLAEQPDGSRKVKVLDFGVSKSLQTSLAPLRLTRAAALLGSPLYMSPEQLDSSRDVDARADVWSLGCILYELITGQPPFTGQSLLQLVHSILTNEPPSLLTHDGLVPHALAETVRRALHKSADERFANASEFSRALAAASVGLDPSISSTLWRGPKSAQDPALAATLEDFRARTRKRPRALVLSLLAGALAALALIMLRPGRDQPELGAAPGPREHVVFPAAVADPDAGAALARKTARSAGSPAAPGGERGPSYVLGSTAPASELPALPVPERAPRRGRSEFSAAKPQGGADAPAAISGTDRSVGHERVANEPAGSGLTNFGGRR